MSWRKKRPITTPIIVEELKRPVINHVGKPIEIDKKNRKNLRTNNAEGVERIQKVNNDEIQLLVPPLLEVSFRVISLEMFNP